MMTQRFSVQPSACLFETGRKTVLPTAQRTRKVAEQTRPTHASGAKAARASSGLNHRDGGSQDIFQGHAFLAVSARVATENHLVERLVKADEAMYNDPPSVEKKQDLARSGVLDVKRAHDHGGSGGNQREHAVSGRRELDRLTFLEEGRNGCGCEGEVVCFRAFDPVGIWLSQKKDESEAIRNEI